MNLYLDDLRSTPENFERVYDYDEFVNFINKNGVPEFISFDHDLGEGKQVSIVRSFWLNSVWTMEFRTSIFKSIAKILWEKRILRNCLIILTD